jgi:hypothetical protein
MTDALIADLARLRALRVISRRSAMRYKGSDKSLPEIARELHVDAVAPPYPVTSVNCESCKPRNASMAASVRSALP